MKYKQYKTYEFSVLVKFIVTTKLDYLELYMLHFECLF